MRFDLKRWAAGLSLVAGIGSAHAAPYSAIYAFGDSLSDVGNVALATAGATPASPYFQGRFSNGPNWLDQLSASLGMGTVSPSLAGGRDYAFGGAVTGSSVPGASTLVPNITQQVGAFTLASGGVASSTALYTMWIGANDIYTALADLAASAISPIQALADVALAAAVEANAVRTLALEGAHTFLVPLVPDLGKTPAAAGLNVFATALSQQYNAALAADLLAVTGALGTDIRLVDTFSLIDQAVANPAQFGFTNVTDPCYVGSLNGGGSVCTTPATYLFWDVEHPTTAADVFIARAALQALGVPEPSTLALLPIALLGLAVARRRKGARR
jgi:phospholipase/lecithinase/hemolysin